MKAEVSINDKAYKVDLAQPIDISLPLSTSSDCPSAWYVQPMKIEPVVMGDWVGDVNRGGSVNFRNIFFNPHGNGTHTECVGHISKENFSINQCLKKFFFLAQVISVEPEEKDEDKVIAKEQLNVISDGVEAIVLRTLPNDSSKLHMQYSNANPPYLEMEAALLLGDNGIKHLLIDLPSIDKEKDDGKLQAHHAFWNYPQQPRLDATITEFIYVPAEIKDGLYLLNLQIASFENDASPSKPLLYTLL